MDPAPVSALPTPTPTPPSSGTPPPSASSYHGRFVGTVTIDGVEHFGDALVTVDGATRLYVGGPYSSSGALQRTKPASSVQFTGDIAVLGDHASGSGAVIAQGCAGPERHRFCAEVASGQINVTSDSGHLRGEIQVRTGGRIESWRLELDEWNNTYELPARLENWTGLYEEELAEFSPLSDVIVRIDAAGRMFFQGAQSGCAGNGTMAPHLDGAFNVYDVRLTIAGCVPPYSYLDGDYEGLGTQTASGYWDYDSLLRIWVSKRDGATPVPAALTMLTRPL